MTIIEAIQAYGDVFFSGFAVAFGWNVFVHLVIGRQMAAAQEFTRMK